MNYGDRHTLYPYLPIVKRPKVDWPDNARVAVWVVPNIEHQTLGENSQAYDVPWFSRLDYANRVGVWRIMSVLDRFGVRGTVALNSSVCRHYPEVVAACLDRKWELMGHGVTNSQGLADLSQAEQAELVVAAISEIQVSTGVRVRGWLSPGLRESPETVDVLRDAGIGYVCDWVNDDLPYRFNNGLWSIPYTNELNDMRLIRPPIYGGDEWVQLAKRAFRRLYEEGADLPRVFCLALHPFVTGLPSRISILEEILEYVVEHQYVRKATGQEIIDHYQRHTD
jgi:peptidoglycan/xylan/chitin deacetylase (PgdA/CDA1 family)